MERARERSTRIAVELTVNALRAMSGRLWISGEIPVDDCALDFPDELIRRVRDAANDAGFGWVQLDLSLNGKCIHINGPKEQTLV
jgi:hypothetical protein